MSSLRPNPLNDPVVRAWDAYAAGDSATSANISEATADLAAALNQLLPPTEPDTQFLTALERRLLGDPGRYRVHSLHANGHIDLSPPAPVPSLERDSRFPGRPFWLTVAALMTLTIAGLVIAFVASRDAAETPRLIPAASNWIQPSPTEEALLDVQMLPADLKAAPPNTWDSMHFARVTIRPGESFTTEHIYFSSSLGILLYQVQEGRASLIVEGPANLYSGTGDEQSTQIEPGTRFTVEAGQTALFALESPAIVTNTGTGDLIMLGAQGYGYNSDQRPLHYEPPDYDETHWTRVFMESFSGDSVRIRLTALTMKPGEHVQVNLTDKSQIIGFQTGSNTGVHLALGELDELPDDPRSSTIVNTFDFTYLSPQTITLFSRGDATSTIYLFHLSPGEHETAAAAPVENRSYD